MYRFLVFILAISILSSCESIVGSGLLVTNEYSVSDEAKSIDVSSVVTLMLSNELEPGQMEIKANENIHKYINIYDGDKELIIYLDNYQYANVEIEIKVSSEQYNDITASGMAEIYVEGEPLYSEELYFTLSGTSSASIAGYSPYLELNLSGASTLNGIDFTCDDLMVDFSGASTGKVVVTNTIEGSLSGASFLWYEGAAEVAVDTVGVSQVIYGFEDSVSFSLN